MSKGINTHAEFITVGGNLVNPNNGMKRHKLVKDPGYNSDFYRFFGKPLPQTAHYHSVLIKYYKRNFTRRYKPHQSTRECARRVKQMEKAAEKSLQATF